VVRTYNDAITLMKTVGADTRRLSLVLALAACLARPAAGYAARPALGPVYRDVFHGFSLRPPLGAERVRESVVRRLVGWRSRDPKTGAIRWFLDVSQARDKPTNLTLSAYAKALAKRFAKAGRFKVHSIELGQVAGKPAMHFRGVWTGAFELWRRQSWIRVKPNEYLVLNIAGTQAAKQQMDALMDAVLGTLKLFDPSAALAERARNLKRGAAVLAGLSDKSLRALLVPRGYYFTIELEGRVVGFLTVTETFTRRRGSLGLRVVRCGALKLPDQPRRLTREEMFATADRKLERWKRVVLEGEGPAGGRSVQEALKQQDLILVQTAGPSGPRRSVERRVPPALVPMYLPQAMDVVLPRLVDRGKPGTYGFAVYNPAANDFDLRTLRVVGPEQVRLGGRTVQATHMTDRMAEDAPTADLWVDQRGILLRMKTADKLLLQRSDRRTVASRFAAELLALEALGSQRKSNAR